MTNPTLDPSERTIREWWEHWSETFQDEYAEAEQEVAVAFGPGVPAGEDLGLLGDVEGLRVIELGCGGAQFGLALAKRGASVTGVDISPTQLEHARELAAEHNETIELVESTVTEMPTIPDSSFDLAVSAFAFQWVEDLQACFDEAHRALEAGGRFVFSVDHPLYRRLDPETGELSVSYFDDSPRRTYSEQFDAEMVIQRRTVADIVNTLCRAGFTIEELYEPGYEDADKYESTFGSFEPEHMAMIPPTLVIAASA
ncbi:class I SAM-dependent methyltransferase [Halovenus marina]|uniref:class I SAM-dependent methyltransferase n=1 Tax=Halovenus marina TaxID=3396621 RepID=UPI003F563C92